MSGIRGTRLRRWFAVAAALACVVFANRALARPEPGLSGAGARKLFEQGNEMFRSALEKAGTDKAAAAALFRDAAAAWRTIALTGGVHNAGLETNIANASLLAGDLPRAIAAFRRAQALDPFDATIRDGLRAARRAAGTEAMAPGAATVAASDTESKGGVRDAVGGVGAAISGAARRALLYLPERGLLWVAGVTYVLAFLFSGARLLGLGRIARWVPVCLLATAMLSSGPLMARDLAATPEGVIVSSKVVARNGPAELYDPAFKEPLAAGIEVRIEERRGEWIRVRLGDGRAAWIRVADVEPI